MITTIDIRELPARLEEALAVAASGGEVILTDGATRAHGLSRAEEQARASRDSTPVRSRRPRTSTRRCRMTSGSVSHEAATRHPYLYLVG